MSSDASAPKYPALAGSRWIDRSLGWLANNQRCVLAFGVTFQVICLLVMMARPLLTLTYGETVLFRVVPLDPHDLFRGDYVTLTYEFSRPPANNGNLSGVRWERMRQMEGRPIYVVLEPEEDGKHWRASRYQFELPPDGKFIRGTITAYGMAQYGIEQFFVEQGHGHEYEKAVRDKKLSAEVSLDKNGSAQIKRLIIE